MGEERLKLQREPEAKNAPKRRLAPVTLKENMAGTLDMAGVWNVRATFPKKIRIQALVGIWLWLSKPFWDPILVGIGEFTTHFRTYLSGDWDVHWGYDLGLLLQGLFLSCFRTPFLGVPLACCHGRPQNGGLSLLGLL